MFKSRKRAANRAVPTRKYAAVSTDELRKLRGHALSSLMRGWRKIPNTPGIYVWRYWPTLSGIDKDTFLSMWRRWKDSQPQFEELLSNRRMTVSVTRTPFSFTTQESILGFALDADKAKNLLAAIEAVARLAPKLAAMESLETPVE